MKFIPRIIVVGTALALLLTVIVLSQLMVKGSPPSIGYADLLIIILTVLSLMITVLGLGLAVLGLVGWATFESKLRDHSFQYFANELGKDGKLRQEFEQLITEISLRGVEPVGPADPADGSLGNPGTPEEKDYVD